MSKYCILIVLLVFSFITMSHADFYTWQDEDGTTHITDYPPPPGKKSLDVKVYKGEDSTIPDPQTAGDESKIKVILFTKNECPDCSKAKDFLNAKKIKFTEYNMDMDKDAEAKRKEYDQNTDVPFAVINRAQVYGFSETVYERALKSVP